MARLMSWRVLLRSALTDLGCMRTLAAACQLYLEFGWRIYKKIGADPQMRCKKTGWKKKKNSDLALVVSGCREKGACVCFVTML